MSFECAGGYGGGFMPIPIFMGGGFGGGFGRPSYKTAMMMAALPVVANKLSNKNGYSSKKSEAKRS